MVQLQTFNKTSSIYLRRARPPPMGLPMLKFTRNPTEWSPLTHTISRTHSSFSQFRLCRSRTVLWLLTWIGSKITRLSWTPPLIRAVSATTLPLTLRHVARLSGKVSITALDPIRTSLGTFAPAMEVCNCPLSRQSLEWGRTSEPVLTRKNRSSYRLTCPVLIWRKPPRSISARIQKIGHASRLSLYWSTEPGKAVTAAKTYAMSNNLPRITATAQQMELLKIKVIRPGWTTKRSRLSLWKMSLSSMM